jgi:hypothetical protein
VLLPRLITFRFTLEGTAVNADTDTDWTRESGRYVSSLDYIADSGPGGSGTTMM